MASIEPIIRRAEPADWAAIAALLGRHDLPLDGARAHLADFLVAVEPAGGLAGVVGLERYGRVGLLRSLAVAAVGTRLGERLTRAVLDVARAQGVRQVVLLTTTAAEYFPRFGFHRLAQADAPLAVQASAEFQGACPDTATVMVLETLTPQGVGGAGSATT